MREPANQQANPKVDRPLATWLFVVAGMVLVMVVLGGLTRLTHSGLSMVEWQPVTGWLPPLTSAEWQAAFDAYRQSPEYLKINAGMTLTGFQEIFWLEYVHRLWGRLIGVAFFVPGVWFAILGRIDRRLAVKLAGLFVLGGLQGALGWFMVQSGLVDRPDVSQYRLAAHLGFAVLIYGAILWIAFGLWRRGPGTRTAALPAREHGYAAALCGLIFVAIIAGAFVAGTDAGFAYNTFPLMDGDLVPPHLLASSPWYFSFFEDITTIQFTHRVLATASLLAALTLAARLHRHPGDVRRAGWILAACALGQFTLGALTVVLIVPVPIAALHQAGAVVLWSAALWTAFVTAARRQGTVATVPARTVAVDRGATV